MAVSPHDVNPWMYAYGVYGSPANLETIISAGLIALGHSQIKDDVLRAAERDYDAALRMAAWPWLYRERGLDERTRVYAIRLTLAEARKPAKVWPAVPAGEQPTLRVPDDGRSAEFAMPIRQHGDKTRPVAISPGYPPQLITPWYWLWGYFLRNYLPWSYRRWVDFLRAGPEQFVDEVALRLDAPVRKDGGDFYDVTRSGSYPDPATETLKRALLSQLTDEQREWYRLLVEIGVRAKTPLPSTRDLKDMQRRFDTSVELEHLNPSAGVAGCEAENIRKKRERLRKRLAEIAEREPLAAVYSAFEAVQGWRPGEPPLGGARVPARWQHYKQSLRRPSTARDTCARHAENHPDRAKRGKLKPFEFGAEPVEMPFGTIVDKDLSAGEVRSIRRELKAVLQRGSVDDGCFRGSVPCSGREAWDTQPAGDGPTAEAPPRSVIPRCLRAGCKRPTLERVEPRVLRGYVERLPELAPKTAAHYYCRRHLPEEEPARPRHDKESRNLEMCGANPFADEPMTGPERVEVLG